MILGKKIQPYHAIAVLPLGATEQHGAHLPFETDWMIIEAIVNAVIEKRPPSSVVFLPVEKKGYSIEHSNRAGVESLNYDEAVERWIGIGKYMNDLGIRKFVMFNAHGGNAPLMTIVATELRVRYKMLAVATSWTRFGYPHNLVSQDELKYGIHGGHIETSVMLAARPELVDMAQARDFVSLQCEMEQHNKHLRAYGPHSFGWMATDLNLHGVVGNSKKANAQDGKKIINHAADGFMELLEDVEKFDVSRFDV